jgi:hypothetical protein
MPYGRLAHASLCLVQFPSPKGIESAFREILINPWKISEPNHNPIMNTLTRKGILAIASLLPAAALAQSSITWQAPVTISGASDVLNTGTLFGTWAPHSDAAGSGLTVNGVTFQAFSDLPGHDTSLDNSTGSGTFASPGTSDANYNNLLTSGAFGNNNQTYTISWSGMTAGDTYAVQLWVHDGRNSTVNQRSETITGGSSTSGSLAYGSGDTGAGQYIIGTFVADGSGSETLTLTPGSAFPSPQFNLLQVRDLTPVPEPSAIALSLIGFGVLFGVLRKK